MGPIVGGIIVDGLGLPLQAIYWSSAILTFGIVLLLAFGSREVRPERIPSGSVIRLAFGAVRGVFTDRATVRLFAIFGVALLANQMARPFIPILVVDLEGSGTGAATGIAVVIGGAALIGALLSPFAGAIGDRIGFRWLLGAALAVAAVVMALLPLAPGVGSLASGNAVLAGCQAATSAMIFGLLAVEVPAERRSATLNLVYLPLYLAGIVGPAIGAVVAGAGVGAVFALAAAILATGALAVGIGLRRSGAARPVTDRDASVLPTPGQSAAAIEATVRELEAENPAELR